MKLNEWRKINLILGLLVIVGGFYVIGLYLDEIVREMVNIMEVTTRILTFSADGKDFGKLINGFAVVLPFSMIMTVGFWLFLDNIEEKVREIKVGRR